MAQRYEIGELVDKTGSVQGASGNVTARIVGAGLTGTVKDLAGNNLTIYQAETGSSTFSNPLTSDAAGRFEGWIEAPDFDLQVSGAGITTYTQKIRQLPFVNVKSYGAKGDGVANDYPAINTAIQSLAATGGTVYFPPGNYKINSTIMMPGPSREGFILRGAGMGVTLLTYAGSAGTYAIQFGNNTAGGETWYPTVEEMTILPSGSPEGAIAMKGCYLGSFRHLRIEGAFGVGIRGFASIAGAYGNYHNRIELCDLSGPTTGILFEGENTGGTGSNSNVITTNQFSAHTRGIWIDMGDSNRIEYNEFDGSISAANAVTPAGGIVLQASVANCGRNTLFSNQFDPSTSGIVIMDNGVFNTMCIYNTPEDIAVIDNGTNTLWKNPVGVSLPSIASATTITLPNRGGGPDGDTYLITGTTQINTINGLSGQQGRRVRLLWNSAVGGTAVGDSAGNINLAGAFAAISAGSSLELMRGDPVTSAWVELGRTII